MEFTLNGKSMGIAFTNFKIPGISNLNVSDDRSRVVPRTYIIPYACSSELRPSRIQVFPISNFHHDANHLKKKYFPQHYKNNNSPPH